MWEYLITKHNRTFLFRLIQKFFKLFFHNFLFLHSYPSYTFTLNLHNSLFIYLFFLVAKKTFIKHGMTKYNNTMIKEKLLSSTEAFRTKKEEEEEEEEKKQIE